MNDRYPGMKWLGSDAFDTEIASEPYHADAGKPLALAGEGHIRRAADALRRIMEWVKDDPKYPAKIALFEAELALRERINAGVVLPDEDRPFYAQWQRENRTWNPAQHAVYAVRLVGSQTTPDGRYWDLGYGSVSAPLDSAAHAIRFAEYLRRRGVAQAQPVVVPCLFSDNESHILLDTEA